MHRMQTTLGESRRKVGRPPVNVAQSAFKYSTKRENATVQKHKENMWKPQQSGPCGTTVWWRVSGGNWVHRTGPCMVK